MEQSDWTCLDYEQLKFAFSLLSVHTIS